MSNKTIAFALVVASSAPVIAADNDNIMVVTASGYEQKIREAAASISVISQMNYVSAITTIWRKR